MENIELDKFISLYKEKIYPFADNIEKNRIKILKAYLIRNVFIFSPLIILLIVVLFFLLKPYFVSDLYSMFLTLLFLFPVIFCLIFICQMLYKQNKDYSTLKYKKIFKDYTIKSITDIFENMQWHWKKNDVRCFDNTVFNREIKNSKFNEYIKSGLFAFGIVEIINVDDEFEGIYKNVPFKVSEIYTVSKQKKYQQIIINYKFNKIINNRTIISDKNAFTDKNSFTFVLIIILSALIISFMLIINNNYSLWFKIYALTVIIFLTVLFSIRVETKEALNKVNLENNEFNKRYNVYSSDQIEARYLVTPLFMEKFYNLKTVFGAKNIKCSFFDDNLMIAIDTKKDLFELGNLFKPVRDIKTIEDFYDEITAIFDMIDYFKLNEDIYLK